MKITAITLQSKNIDRANIFLDGKFYAGVSRIAIYNHKLEIGKEITQAELDKLIFDSDKDKAFDYALTYISKYTPTAKGLANKLYEKGYGKIIVDYTVDKCKKYGYINDREYARSYIAFNSNLKGKTRIRNELKVKGIDENIIEDELAKLPANDLKVKGIDENIIEDELAKLPANDSCNRLAKKKSAGMDLTDPKNRAKLIRFLQYRGYEWEDISQALATVKVVDDDFE